MTKRAGEYDEWQAVIAYQMDDRQLQIKSVSARGVLEDSLSFYDACPLIHQAFALLMSRRTRHYELARHCVEQGIEFTIVASDLSYLTGQRTASRQGFVAEQNPGGVRVLRTYVYPSLHRSFFWRIVSFLSFMVSSVKAALQAGPVDLVMGTSPPIFQAVSPCLWRR